MWHGITLTAGSVVCKIYDWEDREKGVLPSLAEVFAFGQVVRVSCLGNAVSVRLLRVPSSAQLWDPFPLKYLNRTAVTEEWPLAVVHRAVWVSYAFPDHCSVWLANCREDGQLIVPTRWL